MSKELRTVTPQQHWQNVFYAGIDKMLNRGTVPEKCHSYSRQTSSCVGSELTRRLNNIGPGQSVSTCQLMQCVLEGEP